MTRKMFFTVAIALTIILATACQSRTDVQLRSADDMSVEETITRITLNETSMVLMMNVVHAIKNQDIEKAKLELDVIDQLIGNLFGRGLDDIRTDLIHFSYEIRVFIARWEFEQMIERDSSGR